MTNSDSDVALAPLQTALVSALVQAREELGIVTSGTLEELKEQGPESFLRSTIQFPWTPLFWKLLTADKLDLTMESVICRVEQSDSWLELLLGRTLQRAKSNLELAKRLLDAQRAIEQGRDHPETASIAGGYWIVPVQRQTYLVQGLFFNPFGDEGCCAEAEAMERELKETSCCFYEPNIHNHLLFCHHCQSTCTVLQELSGCLAREQFRVCTAHLHLLNEQLRDLAPLGRVRAADQYRRARDWRTIVLASYLELSGDMAKYCTLTQLGRADNGEGVGQFELNPWRALRTGSGDPAAVAFVQELSESLFHTALLACEIQRHEPGLWVQTQPDGSFQVPSCGDVPEVTGLLTPVVRWNLSSWKDWIQDETASGFLKSNKLTAADFLEMAADASAFRNPAVTHPAQDRLRDQPQEEYEEMARRQVRPGIFDRLCRETQDKIVNAEKAFHDTDGLRDYACLVNDLAGGFERQIAVSILSPIRSSWKQDAAPRTAFPGRPELQRDWPFERDEVSLGTLFRVLRKGPSPFRSQVEALGFDVSSLLSALGDVVQDRNLFAHGEPCSFQEARRIRSLWLSVNRPNKMNIFGRILPWKSDGVA